MTPRYYVETGWSADWSSLELHWIVCGHDTIGPPFADHEEACDVARRLNTGELTPTDIEAGRY